MSRNNQEHHEHNEHHDHPGHPHDDSPPPPNESHPVSFGDLVREPWVPGLVEVKFNSPEESGVLDGDFENSGERETPSHQWRDKLLRALLDNHMLAWKPSFPLTYAWSKQSKDDAANFFRKSGRAKFVTFRFGEKADVAQIAADLRKVPQIETAKPVAKLIPSQISEPFLGPDDQVQPLAGGFENQWYAYRCNLTQALEQFKGNGVIIAAIDWGFDSSHEDYVEGLALTKNIYYNNEAVGNGNYLHHGTGALGLAGARHNGQGMVGFAPGSMLWAIQAGEDENMIPDYWRDAIDFVRLEPSTDGQQRRKIIFLEAQTATRGNIESNLTINQAIVDAIAAGVVVCVPAGNAIGKDADLDDQDPPQSISDTGSILVGATRFDAEKNVVSSSGGKRSVVYAPGDPSHDLTCTSLPDRYTNFFGGTSGAVAKVAGAVALLLEANDSLTPAEVRDLLGQSEIPVVDEESKEVGVLLDCGYSVYKCTQRKEPERVLTNYSAML